MSASGLLMVPQPAVATATIAAVTTAAATAPRRQSARSAALCTFIGSPFRSVNPRPTGPGQR